MGAKKALIIPHTHWDREWYQPFQEFRLRLVQLVDKLLDIVVNDADYKFFMLDGQTVVLGDYLEMRPDREALLRGLIHEGRILIGPWFVLPDEFLVSPEALVRNLLLGDRIAVRFGAKMMVGYVPDQFGHISQLPQIFRGFGIEDAVLWRGLDDQPFELRWRSPDGSEVLLIYLRGGYGNAAGLPSDDPGRFTQALQALIQEYGPFARTGLLPLMNGTDHMEPRASLPGSIRAASEALSPLEVEHSTLPRYIAAVRESLGEAGVAVLPLVEGELRSPKVQHVLPGVLSARTWIKQRNAQTQDLLERWAEPWAALAHWTARRAAMRRVPLEPTREIVWRAWQYLLENQPHDSICGCSVDQVHREMTTRYDWAEQIGEVVTRQSLQAIASEIEMPGSDERSLALVVFNPLGASRTDVVEARLELPQSLAEFVLLDDKGQVVPHQVLGREQTELFAMTVSREELRGALGTVREGKVQAKVITDIHLRREGSTAHLDVTLADEGIPDLDAVARWADEIQHMVAEGQVREIEVRMASALRCRVAFVAKDVPGLGYQTYEIRAQTPAREAGVMMATELRIENEFLAVQADPKDGTLSILHKPTGMVLEGANRFVDDGDQGDEYNYCPPEQNPFVDGPIGEPVIRLVESGPARAALEIEMLYELPEALTPDRAARSEARVTVPITTRVSVAAGVPRCDIETTVTNLARDHRLRVHFPTPVVTDCSWAEGSYDVVKRPLTSPSDTEGWVEQPQPTFPQRTFCDVSDGEKGVMVAVRGLPEAEVIPSERGAAIAVTLLRCVGWLSRDDLATRHGSAGPSTATPEAQEVGEHTLSYSVIPHEGGWSEAMAQAHAFATPMRALTTRPEGGVLPAASSFVRVTPGSVVVTAVKEAEDGDGIIVRVCNYADEGTEAKIETLWPLISAEQVALSEGFVDALLVENGNRVRFRCGPWEVVSLRLRL